MTLTTYDTYTQQLSMAFCSTLKAHSLMNEPLSQQACYDAMIPSNIAAAPVITYYSERPQSIKNFSVNESDRPVLHLNISGYDAADRYLRP